MIRKFAFALMLFFIGGYCHAAPVDVLESTLKISALNEEVLWYGFAAGDQIILSFQEVNGKDLKEIEVTEYPSSTKFSDYKTDRIDNKIITVNNTGIYKFRFENASLGGRVCKIKIQRIPASPQTANFNTSVYWNTITDTTYTFSNEQYLVKKEYVPHQVIKEKYYINSGTNATFKGGRSRVIIPLPLPPKTIGWYYEFSSFRNENDINKTHQTMNLFGELSKFVDPSGVAKLTINALTQPPGGSYCDIFVMNAANAQLFEQKAAYKYFTTYSKENIASGIVEVGDLNYSDIFIGIRNPDNMYGEYVSIEVVAITLNEQWGTREIRHPAYKTRKEPFLKY